MKIYIIYRHNFKKYYYVAMWHFVMGYNIIANNGDQLQTLYRWLMVKGVYFDHIHHPCEM